MRDRWLAALAAVFVVGLALGVAAGAGGEDNPITRAMVSAASRLIGLDFTDAETDSMLTDLGDYAEGYAQLRAVELDNAVPPALAFNPLPVGFALSRERSHMAPGKPRQTEVPGDIEELCFYSVRDLAELIRTRKISSLQLTEMYLSRLERFGPELECVVTLTKKRALEAAKRADEEIADGRYRGYLHGIPYGAKDLLAVAGYKTTWGAAPYKDQIIDEDATVIKKLDAAGAVLVAKLTLGALAWGDVWYGGMTRNPWNLEQGSSGSSAGSASATAAGLVAFAIGTETWGSIVSPSTRCGTTGLRPTYGRVSRTGAMALSWSMDKIGPICRTVEDCALVFNAIRGRDGIDQTLVEAPFRYNGGELDLSKIRIGYYQSAFEDSAAAFPEQDRAALETLRELGAKLIPIELPDYPMSSLAIILTAEAAAAFDALTRSGRDDLMVRQIKNAWPNVFRGARFIPAVEYIQANRVRYRIIQDMQDLMDEIDVYVSPSFGGDNLLLTNLTSHPCVVVPNGTNDERSPVSITFIGRLFDEGTVLAVARTYQEATGFHLDHPARYMPEPAMR